jgi:inosine-uridine nucleoside N-ribohydrolase
MRVDIETCSSLSAGQTVVGLSPFGPLAPTPASNFPAVRPALMSHRRPVHPSPPSPPPLLHPPPPLSPPFPTPTPTPHTQCDVWHQSGRPKNCNVARAMDVEGFWGLMLDALDAADAASPQQ